MKSKIFGGVSVFLIILTILTIIVTLVLVMLKSNPKRTFMEETVAIYNRVIDKKEEDDKSNLKSYLYSATILLKEDHEFRYVGKFNSETDELNYLCVSNGSRIIEIKKENITADYIEEFGIIELSNKQCKVEEEHE